MCVSLSTYRLAPVPVRRASLCCNDKLLHALKCCSIMESNAVLFRPAFDHSSAPPPLPQCFTCSTCRNRLVPGDRFHYVNGSLFCEHDRPTALINGHLSSLQTNPLLSDQKVRPSTLSTCHSSESVLRLLVG